MYYLLNIRRMYVRLLFKPNRQILENEKYSKIVRKITKYYKSGE